LRKGRSPHPEGLFLMGVVGFFFTTSMLRLSRPGCQYDELLFGNAALGVVDPHSFLHRAVAGVPVFLMPYIGALKAYLYYPIFKIFSVNIYSIRVPAILFGCFILTLTYAYTRRLFGSRAARMTTLLLALDPTFMFTNRVDWGLSSLAMLLKSTALFFLVKGIQTSQVRPLVGALFFTTLGIFHRLDFIWFVNATLVSLGIAFHKEVASWVRMRKRWAAMTALMLSLGGVYLVYSAIKMSIRYFGENPFDIVSLNRLRYVTRLLLDTLNGNAFYFDTTHGHLTVPSPQGWVGLGVIATCILVGRMQRRRTWNRWVGFFVALFGVTLLQIYLTRRASGVHHMMMLYPFPHVILGYFLTLGWTDLRSGTGGRFLRAVVGSSLAVIVVFNLGVIAQYLAAYRQDRTSPVWSSDIYTLIDYVKRHKGTTFVSIDWGLHTQLLTFTRGNVPLKEMVWSFKDLRWDDLQLVRWLIDAFLCQPDYRFLAHSDAASVFPEAKRNFFDLAARHGLEVRRVDTVGKRQLYEVYAVRCESPGR